MLHLTENTHKKIHIARLVLTPAPAALYSKGLKTPCDHAELVFVDTSMKNPPGYREEYKQNETFKKVSQHV